MGTNRCMQRLQQIFELMEINSIESKYLSNINFPKIFKPIHYKRPSVFFGLNREKPIWNNVILERKKHPTENTKLMYYFCCCLHATCFNWFKIMSFHNCLDIWKQYFFLKMPNLILDDNAEISPFGNAFQRKKSLLHKEYPYLQ